MTLRVTVRKVTVYHPAEQGNADLESGGLPPSQTGNAGRFTACRTGERGVVYTPAGRGNARQFTPAGRGNARQFTPAGRGNADWECGGLPPAGRGTMGSLPLPLPDGGTLIWNVAVYPCRTGERRLGLWRFTPVILMSQPPLPTFFLYYFNVGDMQEDHQDECNNRKDAAEIERGSM